MNQPYPSPRSPATARLSVAERRARSGLPAPALPAPALPAPALPNTPDDKQVFLTIVRIFNISFLVGTYSLIIMRKVF
ncbi:MAG: hypothetical protein DWQ51_16900 [Microcystis wesenbergii TW10]|uniref:Uncharacterized protein n=1 Tax=Microcystis wesenbergii TW10 TaxID=2060474 RepID=A0A3E0LQR8_9CHRO|nr:MAG: hypothetical protein DWQ51_16900 [Microcystis wesenbergii TW10]